MANSTSLRYVMSDVNGETYRADEPGFTLLAQGDYNIQNVCTGNTCSGVWRSGVFKSSGTYGAKCMRVSDRFGDVLLLSTSDDQQHDAIVSSGRER